MSTGNHSQNFEGASQFLQALLHGIVSACVFVCFVCFQYQFIQYWKVSHLWKICNFSFYKQFVMKCPCVNTWHYFDVDVMGLTLMWSWEICLDGRDLKAVISLPNVFTFGESSSLCNKLAVTQTNYLVFLNLVSLFVFQWRL